MNQDEIAFAGVIICVFVLVFVGICLGRELDKRTTELKEANQIISIYKSREGIPPITLKELEKIKEDAKKNG